MNSTPQLTNSDWNLYRLGTMSSATSSSLERSRARKRVERNRRRARQQTFRSRSETSTSRSRDAGRGRRVHSHGRNRRKRTPSPGFPRKRKMRSRSYNNRSRSRSSSPGGNRIYPKFRSFQRSYRQRSGSGKRHDPCYCPRAERERARTKRKERHSSRNTSRYSGREKRHKRSCSSDDARGGDPKVRSPWKLKQGKQRKREDDQCTRRFASPALGLGVEMSVSGISHSAESGELAMSFNTRSRRGHKLQTPEDAKLSTLSHQTASSDAMRKTGPNFGHRENSSDPNGLWLAPNSKGAKHKKALGSLEANVNDSNDWLNLSLKAPTMPKPTIKGVRREDLQLCLDSMAQSTSYSQDGSEEGEIRPRKQARVSCTVPSILPTSANNSTGSGTLSKDMMGSNKVSLSNFDTSSTRELHSTGGLSVFPRVRDANVYPILAPSKTNFLKRLVTSPHLDNVVELSDSSSTSSKKSKDEGVDVNSHPKEASHKSVGKDDGVNLCSSVQTIGQVFQQSAAQAFSNINKPESVGNVMELSNSLSEQEDSREKRNPLPDCHEVDSREQSALVKLSQTCTRQVNVPTVVSNSSKDNQEKPPKQPSGFYPIVELSSDEEGDDNEQASLIRSRSQLWPALKKKIGSSKPFYSPTLKVPEAQSTRLHFRSTGHSNSIGHQDLVVDPSDSPEDPERQMDVQAPFEVIQNSSPVPTKQIVREECFNSQMEVLPPHKPAFQPPDNSYCPQASIEVVELSDSESTYIDASDNDRADSFEGREVLGVKFPKESQLLKSSRTVECDEGSKAQNAVHMNDVACCSIKPPPQKTGKSASALNKIGKYSFVRDKNGNLVQVIEVEDSDNEGGGGHTPKRYEVDVTNLDGEENGVDLQKRRKSSGEGRVYKTRHQIHNALQELEEAFKVDGQTPDYCSDDNQAIRRFSLRSLQSRQRSPLTNFDASSELPRKTQRSKFRKLVLEESGSNESDESDGEDEADTISTPIEPKYGEMWKHGIRCDLCGLGPSLSLGEWCAWCCGLPASRCHCAEQKKTSKQMAIGFRKAQKTKHRGNKIFVHQWSGKVHKMCALWSSEVFEKESTKKVKYLRLLDAAVKRGNSIICKDPDCKKAGATLGCRVKNCRRSYHYPCAEKLSSGCLLRMWDCLTIPIACMNHRYVETEVDRAKEKIYPATIAFDRDTKMSASEWKPYLGFKLLCEDIAEGQEAVKIPCTNDVDDDCLPKMIYITKCWRKGHPVENLHPSGTKLARGCSGCVQNFDSPVAPISVHIMGASGSRESDERLDWQSEKMYGRLPYNNYGLLQLGTETKDIVECNSRCKCGPECKNRELQKGLQVSLELFKTEDCGWGVRSLQQIPRGRFVVEYVGDVLTQAEADEQAEKYDQNQLSYLFNLDHPVLGHEDAIVLDGIHMSNIARFINHSCEGNLMVYRVYSETTECRYFRIGMYAIQDIEVGDQLSYDYNYAVSKESSDLPVDDPTAIRCCCGAQSCRKWLWRGGNDAQLKH